MDPINFQIMTNELSIRANSIPDGNYQIAPRFTRTIWSEEQYGCIRLIAELKNTEENPFPVDITADMTARIELNQVPVENIEEFLKIQGVQLLLPYIRTMISTVTSSTLMPPIVLPLYNPMDLFTE